MSIGLNEFTKRNAKQQRPGKRHDAEPPVQQPRDIAEDMGDEDMDDKDAGVDYEPTSAEEETDAASLAKRQRLAQLRRGQLGVQGAVAVPADEPTRGETPDVDQIAKLFEQVYESLNRLCDKEALKFFIESFDQKFTKKVQRDVRRTERRDFGKSKADVAEVYSPLRVCTTARKVGLKAGF